MAVEKSASSEEPSVCTIFSDSAAATAAGDAAPGTVEGGTAGGGDPFDNISIQQGGNSIDILGRP